MNTKQKKNLARFRPKPGEVQAICTRVEILKRQLYRVAKMHRMPYVAGLFPQKSH